METFSGAKSACAPRYLLTAIAMPIITAVMVSNETIMGDKNSSEWCSLSGLTTGSNQCTSASPRAKKNPETTDPTESNPIGINMSAGLSAGSSLCPHRSLPKKVSKTTLVM